MVTKSIFMTIAWLNFYALNWLLLVNRPIQYPAFFAFIWIIFAVLAVISTNYKENTEKK